MESFSQDIYQLCLVIFNSVSKSCSYFVPLIFFMRLGFGGFMGITTHEVGQIVKGVILYFILIFSFQYILELIFLIPQAVSLDMESRSLFSGTEFSTPVSISGENKGFLPELLRDLIESVISFLFYVARFFYLLFLMLLSSLAPIVFLLSCLLGIGMGVQIFFGLLISAASWPIVWHGFDALTNWISRGGTTEFGAYSYELVAYFMKVVGPIGIAFTALNSGPGKSIVSSMTKTISQLRPISMGAFKFGNISSTAAVGGYKGVKAAVEVTRSNNRNRSYTHRASQRKESVIFSGVKGAYSGARHAVRDRKIKERFAERGGR